MRVHHEEVDGVGIEVGHTEAHGGKATART
jgi:hypothetical protein